MKKNLKSIIIIPICIILLFLCACRNESYKDINTEELADTIEDQIKLDKGYYNVSDRYFDYYFKIDGESIKNNVSEWTIRCSSSQSSENEFGIIKAVNGKAREVELACTEYIENRRITYLDAKSAYSPDEYKKYQSAKVITYGNTVIYFILSSEDIENAERTIKEITK